MEEANLQNLTMHLGVEIPSTTSENTQKQKRHRWKDSEDIILFKQYRGSDPAEWKGKEDEMEWCDDASGAGWNPAARFQGTVFAADQNLQGKQPPGWMEEWWRWSVSRDGADPL